MVYELVDLAPVSPNFFVCDSSLYGSTLEYEDCLQIARDLPIGSESRPYHLGEITGVWDNGPYTLPVERQLRSCELVIEISGPNYNENERNRAYYEAYITPDLIRGWAYWLANQCVRPGGNGGKSNHSASSHCDSSLDRLYDWIFRKHDELSTEP